MNVELIDRQEYELARLGLGDAFIRILGYFREDGTKSVDAVEQAMRARNAAALVIPAHTLKGEARQFGAQRLADMAEHIEMVARRCVEYHEDPEELIEFVAELRDCFMATVTALEEDASPLVTRKAGGARRGSSINFGRG
ncbi:Hpt domain-containing protein [Sphingobium subterraneum]|uniref:HPt (Histidine-containing phosphotransfer) domain-containing protein n=1 Tax=Sphingobium subterraneum TaxID=627688 RepID=A0A841J3A4_9SPHN|nr:Hpt domain-containing protein [Sphingobium subterraneum]MBB6124822.1 HPt (histidine-containing phosphotransfer) domain-containing protein [Sphingobium subterraneum]